MTITPLENPSAPVGHTAKRRAIIRTVVEVAAPLIAYYGLRAAGNSEYVALLAATVVAGLPVAYGLATTRRVYPYAGYLMLMFGMTLTVALVTTDPQLILAGQTLVGAAAAMVFLFSCVIGEPMTRFVAERFMPADDPMSVTVQALHTRLSMVVGVGMLAQVAICLAIIFSQPFDVANGLVNLVGYLAVLLIGGVIMLMVRRRKVSAFACVGAPTGEGSYRRLP